MAGGAHFHNSCCLPGGWAASLCRGLLRPLTDVRAFPWDPLHLNELTSSP